MDVTSKNFGFATKNDPALYYVSASNGTNVVKLFRWQLYSLDVQDFRHTFRDAIDEAVKYKANPTDIDDQILEELDNFDYKPAS